MAAKKPKKPLTEKQAATAKAKAARAKEVARAQPLPEGGILQVRHMDRKGKGLVNTEVKKWGKAASLVREVQADALDHLDPDTPTDPKTDTAKKVKELNAANQILDRKDPLVKNVTGHSIAAMASKREGLWADGIERAKLHGDVRRSDRPASTPEMSREESAYWNHPMARSEKPHPLKPSETASHYGPLGADWYIDAGQGLKQMAEMHGQDPAKVIGSSSIQSPQNSPEGERRSVAAMAEAVNRDYPITPINEEGATQIGVPVGESINFNQLDSDVIGRSQEKNGIANKKHAANFDTQVKLTEIAHGGTGKGNGLRAMRADIEGSIDYGVPENSYQEQISGMASGKVPSYNVNLQDAANADANDISEHHRRARFIAGVPEHDDPNQMLLLDPKDPYGRAHSREGILDPERTTAGDTWMRGLDMNLPKGERRLKSGTSVSKSLGSTDKTTAMSVTGIYPTPKGHAAVSPDQIRNAVSNAADIMAAENLSDRARARVGLSKNTPVVKFGNQADYLPVGLSSVPVQAASWTETRIQSVNDPLVPKELKEQSAGPATGRLDHFAAGASVKPPPKRRGSPVQQGLKEAARTKPNEIGTMDISSPPMDDKQQASLDAYRKRRAASIASDRPTPSEYSHRGLF